MGHKLQKSLGVDTYFVNKSLISKYADFLYLEDVISGSFCPLEAHANPHSVIEAYLKAIRSLGVSVYTNREVTGIGISAGRVTSISTDKGPISTGTVINCAGPWAGNIANMVGGRLPIVTRKRHVLIIKPSSNIDQNIPLIVDSGSGLYLKPEPGNLMLMGGTDRNGLVSQDTLRHPETIDRIIEAGVKRAPSFESAGHIKTIVGLRALSPDDHSIIGKIPYVEGFYCAAGFSGHGFMHAPAAAAALTELILYGKSILFNIDAFDPSRFERRTRKRAQEKYIF
jgi:sarcosine oxidase subunit beta